MSGSIATSNSLIVNTAMRFPGPTMAALAAVVALQLTPAIEVSNDDGFKSLPVLNIAANKRLVD